MKPNNNQLKAYRELKANGRFDDVDYVTSIEHEILFHHKTSGNTKKITAIHESGIVTNHIHQWER